MVLLIRFVLFWLIVSAHLLWFCCLVVLLNGTGSRVVCLTGDLCLGVNLDWCCFVWVYCLFTFACLIMLYTFCFVLLVICICCS